MITNVADHGQKLIEEIKEHIIESLASHPRGKIGVTVSELQEFSGLTIKGYSGGEVWLMGVITLLVELLKKKRIQSEVSSLNTRDWRVNTKVWLQ